MVQAPKNAWALHAIAVCQMELAKAISHLGPDHEAIDLYHQAENLFRKPGDVDYTMISICMQRVAALQGKNESRSVPLSLD